MNAKRYVPSIAIAVAMIAVIATAVGNEATSSNDVDTLLDSTAEYSYETEAENTVEEVEEAEEQITLKAEVKAAASGDKEEEETIIDEEANADVDDSEEVETEEVTYTSADTEKTEAEISSSDLEAATNTEEEVEEVAKEEDEVEIEMEEEPITVCVCVTADGNTDILSLSPNASVYDALEEANVTVGNYDIINVSYSDKVYDGLEVVVKRVTYSNDTAIEVIDYDIEYREDDTILLGESEVLTSGREGRAILNTRTKYIDGVEVSTEIVSREITVPVIDRIILIGTLEVVEEVALDNEEEEVETLDVSDSGVISQLTAPDSLELDENGLPVNYAYTLYGSSCAYTASVGALMSTGKAVAQGYVAVDPNVIPYGTELYIVSDDGQVYGYAIAADTGTSVRRGEIIVDLFMNEYNDCIEWGRRNVTIYVLN